MSYTALYRKYRPKDFNDVYGQDHIVKTLKNQIITNRISHAYLFCGTRGTGKTSTAKIFARAINCINSIEGNCCNECETCKDILDGRSMNVIEIDAASNNGVDNIRQIRDEVKYPPTQGKYKVYIIDEVHMLSIGAFNALLKTLEEPPEHVIFILATTDPQKIPPTILSRCQRYDFHRISKFDMTKNIKDILDKENVSVDDNAIDYITRLSDGAMRDALSILDQAIAFNYGENISLEKVLNIVGSVDTEVFFQLVDALINKDSGTCLAILDNCVMSGRDISQLAHELITHLRNLLVVKNSTGKENIIDLSEESIVRLKNQASNISSNAIMNFITEVSNLEAKMKYSSNNRILFEILLIKLCSVAVNNNGGLEEIFERLSKLESGQITFKKEEKTQKKEVKPKVNLYSNNINKAVSNSELDKKWEEVKSSFADKISLFALLGDSVLKYVSNNTYNLEVPTGTRINILNHVDEIKQKLSEAMSTSVEIHVLDKTKEIEKVEDDSEFDSLFKLFGDDLDVQ